MGLPPHLRAPRATRAFSSQGTPSTTPPQSVARAITEAGEFSGTTATSPKEANISKQVSDTRLSQDEGQRKEAVVNTIDSTLRAGHTTTDSWARANTPSPCSGAESAFSIAAISSEQGASNDEDVTCAQSLQKLDFSKETSLVPYSNSESGSSYSIEVSNPEPSPQSLPGHSSGAKDADKWTIMAEIWEKMCADLKELGERLEGFEKSNTLLTATVMRQIWRIDELEAKLIASDVQKS